jgi:hypothetical protein
MMAVTASQRILLSQGLPLSLSEQLAHIPRGLIGNLVDNFGRISSNVMRSKSR